MRQIYREVDIGESKGRLWKRQRDNIGYIALRKTHKQSNKLGRKSKVMYQMLMDHTRTVTPSTLSYIKHVFKYFIQSYFITRHPW